MIDALFEGVSCAQGRRREASGTGSDAFLCADFLLPLMGVLLLTAGLSAQSPVKVRLSPDPVYLGQQAKFSVVWTASQEIELAEAPSGEGLGLKFIDARVTGTQRVVIRGGRVRERFTYEFLFALTAERAGTLRLQGGSLRAGGETQPIPGREIVVLDPADQKTLRVEARFSRDQVVVGETVTLEVDALLALLDGPRVSSSDPLQFHDRGIRSHPAPSLTIPSLRAPPVGSESFDSVEWATSRLLERGAKGLMLSQYGGGNRFGGQIEDVVRTLGGEEVAMRRYRFTLELRADAAGRHDFGRAIFEGVAPVKIPRGYGMQRFFFRTDPLVLEVVEAPTAGRPASFDGAVGQFSLRVSPPTPTALRVGDALFLTAVVQGAGFLSGVDLRLEEQLGPDFRVERPKVFDSSTPEELRPDGWPQREGAWRQWEYRIRPRSKRVQELPELSFSYFDTASREYRTVRAGPWPITVTGEELAAPSAEGSAPSGELDLVASGLAPNVVSPERMAQGRLSLWWPALGLLLGAPLVLALGAVWSRRRGRAADPRLRRERAAGPLALKRCDAARELTASDPVLGLRELRGALCGWLADTRGCEEGAITSAEWQAALAEAPLSAEEGRALRTALDAAEAAEFGGGTASGDELAAGIEALESWLRSSASKRGLGSAAPALWVLVMLASGVPVAAQTPASLTSAEEAFQAGRFEEAARSYEQLIQDPYASGALNYNAGNAWQRAGRIGRAIAAYRRAEVDWRGDENLQRNLQAALEGRGQAAGLAAEPTWLRTLSFWRQHLGLGAQSQLAAWLVGVTLVLLLASALWPRAPGGLRPLALVCALLAAVVLLAAWLDQRAHASGGHGVIVDAATILRGFPTQEGEAVLAEALQPGAEFRVLELRPEWLRVEVGGEHSGWLPRRRTQLW